MIRTPAHRSTQGQDSYGERGLMADQVAMRCERLKAPEDRDLIWFLQLLSYRDGGLKQVALDLLGQFPERNATVSMRRFGMKPGQVYSRDQVKAVRKEIADRDMRFRLKGEISDHRLCTLPEIPQAESYDTEDPHRREWAIAQHRDAKSEANEFPDRYPAEAFVQACREAADGLAELLTDLCLDSEMKLEAIAPWYFPSLIESLREFKTAWIESRRCDAVVTEIGAKVFETLDFALQESCMVLIEGRSRTGKTFAAKKWCEANPGSSRYIKLESGSDQISFFRCIAEGLGVSMDANSNPQKLKMRILDALKDSKLLLVVDEASHLWPNLICKQSVPARISWLLTALVNRGVPIALVSAPQFTESQMKMQKIGWSSEQFIGRLGHYERLPDSLNEKDLFAVAGVALPEGDSVCHELLVRYAQGSAKYLAAIEMAVRRARFIAKRDGRSAVTRKDVKRAITESVIPSDSALAKALKDPGAAGRRRQTSEELAMEIPERQSLPLGFGAGRRGEQVAEATC